MRAPDSIRHDTVSKKTGFTSNNTFSGKVRLTKALNLERNKNNDEEEQEEEDGLKARQKFPSESTSALKKWLLENIDNPYLKHADKVELTKESGLTKLQIQNWFINIRKVRS